MKTLITTLTILISVSTLTFGNIQNEVITINNSDEQIKISVYSEPEVEFAFDTREVFREIIKEENSYEETVKFIEEIKHEEMPDKYPDYILNNLINLCENR